MSIFKKSHIKTALRFSFPILLVSMIITITSCQSNHKKIATAYNTCHNHNITHCAEHENCDYHNDNCFYESENCEENHCYGRRNCHRR